MKIPVQKRILDIQWKDLFKARIIVERLKYPVQAARQWQKEMLAICSSWVPENSKRTCPLVSCSESLRKW